VAGNVHGVELPDGRWREITRQIEFNLLWVICSSLLFGLELASALWKPPSPFYPFPLLIWGMLTILWTRLIVAGLSQLGYFVKLEDAGDVRSATRRLIACTLCSAAIWVSLGFSVGAAKRFSSFYVALAAIAGITAISMTVVTAREIRRLPVKFPRAFERRSSLLV